MTKSATAKASAIEVRRATPAALAQPRSATVTPLYPQQSTTVPSRGVGRALRLCGLELHDTTLMAAADWIVDRAVSRKQTTVGFINAHCVNVLAADEAYGRAVRRCDRLFIDGSGMRLAARLGGVDITENVNGTDLFPVLCDVAARQGASMFLLGGRPGIADGAAQNMIERTPDLAVAGTADGYFGSGADEDALIERINASGADIVLVGLGVPRQEIWITANRNRLKAAVVIGVGGLFDYYSGRIARAPAVIRAAGMEWAWRLAMEPQRLANRYLVGNVVFLARILSWRLKSPATFCTSTPATR